MPLPEVWVAEFRMAFTASWSADGVPELVELEEPVCPRSWLNDSVELPPKLERSEPIELLLIPLLLCAAWAYGSGGGALDSYVIGKLEISLNLANGSSLPIGCGDSYTPPRREVGTPGLRLHINAGDTCISDEGHVQTFTNLAQRLGGNFEQHISRLVIHNLIVRLVLGIDP